eukprot:SAG11_NODE_2912_length_2844_cov_4.296539_2_plen_387_part_00
MPQGGSGGKGNGGGGSQMAGGSKKKLGGSKSRSSSFKPKPKPKGGGALVGPDVAEREATAHTAIRPRTEARAQVLAAQRRGAQAHQEAVERAARRAAETLRRPVNGTAPGGSVLGGGVALPERDVAAARVRFLAARQAQSRVERRERERHEKARLCTESCAPMPARRPPVVGAAAAADDVGPATTSQAQRAVMAHVAAQLDFLAARLGGNETAAVRRLLRTVLANAAGKGRAEQKYRRLRSRNERLWRGMLCHPEPRAVLAAAGFAPVRVVRLASAGGGEVNEEEELRLAQLRLVQHLEVESPDQSTVAELLAKDDALRCSAVDQPPPDCGVMPEEGGEREVEWVFLCEDEDEDEDDGEAAKLRAALHAVSTWDAVARSGPSVAQT